jgi:hypothetical protein
MTTKKKTIETIEKRCKEIESNKDWMSNEFLTGVYSGYKWSIDILMGAPTDA